MEKKEVAGEMNKDKLRVCVLNIIWLFSADPREKGITFENLKNVRWFRGQRTKTAISFLFEHGFILKDSEKFVTSDFGNEFVSNYCFSG